MAIPERMIPVKVSSKKIRELAQKAKEIPVSYTHLGFGNGLRGHRRVTYQAVRTFNLSSGLG